MKIEGLILQLNTLQVKVDNLQQSILPQNLEKIEKIQQQIKELEILVKTDAVELKAKVNAITALADDVLTNTNNVLTHANSVLTFWVGIATVVIAIVTISIMAYLKKQKDKEVRDLIENAFKDENFKKHHSEYMSKYFQGEDFKSLLVEMAKPQDTFEESDVSGMIEYVNLETSKSEKGKGSK